MSFMPMGPWRACLGKIGRPEAIKLYKVKLMRPDGSVVFARTAEPRVLIQLPIDLRTADEYERRIRIAERRPMVKREFEDLGEDTFNHQKYTTQWKR